MHAPLRRWCSRAEGHPGAPTRAAVRRTSEADSLLVHDLAEQLLRVILVPDGDVLPRGNLRLGGRRTLLLHGDGDLEVALGALDLSFGATVLDLRARHRDALRCEYGAGALLHVVGRALHDRLRAAAG